MGTHDKELQSHSAIVQCQVREKQGCWSGELVQRSTITMSFRLPSFNGSQCMSSMIQGLLMLQLAVL